MAKDKICQSIFKRYIGIDYSGADMPNLGLKWLRVYEAERETGAVEIKPSSGPSKYWTRIGLAEWLADRLSEDIPTIVGMDHGFSFPLKYFEMHKLPLDWHHFLDDFKKHWPTDLQYMCVDFVRNGRKGNGAARSGNPRWRRISEARVGAKSVFHFDVPGSVAKSTHAGLPWLWYLRNQLESRLHFWPFDGWEIPNGKSAIAEIYPSLWNRLSPREDRTPDQHDAYVVCSWLQQTDREGQLAKFLNPELSPKDKEIAKIEGWILGVV